MEFCPLALSRTVQPKLIYRAFYVTKIYLLLQMTLFAGDSAWEMALAIPGFVVPCYYGISVWEMASTIPSPILLFRSTGKYLYCGITPFGQG